MKPQENTRTPVADDPIGWELEVDDHQHVHHDLTIDRVDAVAARTNRHGAAQPQPLPQWRRRFGDVTTISWGSA